MTGAAAYPPGTPERDVYSTWRDSVAAGHWSSTAALLKAMAQPALRCMPPVERLAILDGVLDGTADLERRIRS